VADARRRPIRVLGRYALYDSIASGGMASVHLGRLVGQVGFARTVAIKRLHPHYATEPEFVSMFLDEARLAGRIQHPNVVMTLDVVAEATELFLVMEYVQGEALNRLLQATKSKGAYVPPRVAVAIACDVLHGLAAAHEAKNEEGQPLGIVHRDVSPQNVLVGTDGVTRVLDFGIAKAASRLQTTEDGQLKGKIGYMSPEQLLGLDVDLRTDIWATSVLLWETLACQRLFVADSQGEIFGRVQKGDVAAPSTRMPKGALQELTDEERASLDALVIRGLARAATDRFQSAREMANALEACLSPATRGQVASWVRENARDALELRSELVREIERSDELSVSPPGALLSALRSSSPSETMGVATGSAPDDDNIETRLDAIASERPPPSRVVEKLIRWRRIAAGLGAGLLLLGALVVGAVVVRQRRAEPPAPSTPGVGAARRALTEWPAPTSTNREALAAYLAGLQALRDGSSDTARFDLERAAKLDPTLGAATLRLAILQAEYTSMGMDLRESFSKAVQLKTTLSERDAALEKALEPIVLIERPDIDTWEARMGYVLARHPDDAELFFYLGLVRRELGRIEEAREPLARAIAIDPGFGLALGVLAEVELYLGHGTEAGALVDRCLKVSSTGSDCLWVQTLIDEEDGACAHQEADARAWIARVPDDGYAHYTLARALAAEDKPAEAVHEALKQKWSYGARPLVQRLDLARLDVFAGDFVGAEAEAKAIETLEPDHSVMNLPAARELLAHIYLETNRPGAARALLERIVASREALLAPSMADDVALSQDPFPYALSVLARLGARTTVEARAGKDQWVKERTARKGFFEHAVWVWGYAHSSETRADAEEALALLPAFEPLPRSPQTIAPAAVGHALFLAGHVAEALPFLRKGAASCAALIFPFDHFRSLLELGMALEPTDPAGACASYARILAHWGSAKPASMTAATARTRVTALGCTSSGDR
jgi:eukaryotic-like serine/threonine-protein kinase